MLLIEWYWHVCSAAGTESRSASNSGTGQGRERGAANLPQSRFMLFADTYFELLHSRNEAPHVNWLTCRKMGHRRLFFQWLRQFFRWWYRPRWCPRWWRISNEKSCSWWVPLIKLWFGWCLTCLLDLTEDGGVFSGGMESKDRYAARVPVCSDILGYLVFLSWSLAFFCVLIFIHKLVPRIRSFLLKEKRKSPALCKVNWVLRKEYTGQSQVHNSYSWPRKRPFRDTGCRWSAKLVFDFRRSLRMSVKRNSSVRWWRELLLWGMSVRPSSSVFCWSMFLFYNHQCFPLEHVMHFRCIGMPTSIYIVFLTAWILFGCFQHIYHSRQDIRQI